MTFARPVKEARPPVTQAHALDISVVVPTYKRPLDLYRCLGALCAQEKLPDEVLVVVRSDEDPDAIRVMGDFLETVLGSIMRRIDVVEPGLAAALIAGSAASRCALIAVTDDDAAPRPDWLLRMVGHYNDRIGGVGGRDVIHSVDGIVPASARRVGVVNWWGRQVGQHHAGIGEAREVDVLKGANMSLRRDLCKFDHPVHGSGTQIHTELFLCLRARRLGWKLIYDPQVLVDHYPADRPDGDDRSHPAPKVIEDVAYNQMLGLLTYAGPLQVVVRSLYRLTMGESACPGLLRALIGWMRGEDLWGRLTPSYRGVTKALVMRLSSAGRRTAKQTRPNLRS